MFQAIASSYTVNIYTYIHRYHISLTLKRLKYRNKTIFTEFILWKNESYFHAKFEQVWIELVNPEIQMKRAKRDIHTI